MQTFPASAYHLSYVVQGRPCFLLMHHGNDLHRSSLARSAHDPCADARTNWTCVGSVDCLRVRTVRGKESSATNKPGIPTGVSPRSYPAG
jgi:hypothetical protein